MMVFIKGSNQQEQRKYRHRLIQQFFNVSFNIFQRVFFQLLLILHHLPLSSPAGNQNFIYNMQIQ